MNRIGLLAFCATFVASFCCGQTSTPAAAPAAIGHGAFPVKITKTLDSSKLKEGDTVEVETAGSFKLPDGTLVSKKSKLTGHVTAAKSRSKGDPESQLTLTFDQLKVADGKQVSIKGMVQAVFPPAEDEPAPNMAGKASGAAGGGASNVGATVGTVTDDKSGSNTDISGNAQSVMNPKSVGVQGVHDLQLENGVLTSKGKQVKLGSGDRMIVHVDIFK